MGTRITFSRIDQAISAGLQRWSPFFVRGSLALTFIWFGILKPLQLSSAEPLVLLTVKWLPLLEPRQWLHVVGWWEVAIGITFLFKRTTKIAIVLLLLQMVGSFMPLFLYPDIAFQEGKVYKPTLEGQYIIKDLLVIGAALMLGGFGYGTGGGQQSVNRARGGGG